MKIVLFSFVTLTFQEPARVTKYEGEDQFPHGPRNFEEENEANMSKEAEDRAEAEVESEQPLPLKSNLKMNRRKRSVVVSDRKVRSADVGVSGLYEVISEADLAFSPDARAEAVTVFQGRIREEVVYGICLPMSGFSALFVVVALSAVVSALIAGAMLHRLQTQRELLRGSRKNNRAMHPTSNGWLAYGLLRVRCSDRPQQVAAKSSSSSPASIASNSVQGWGDVTIPRCI